MAEQQNDIELLIARHLAGNTNAAEEQQLKEWIESTAANRKLYDASRRAFELSAQHYDQQSENNDAIDVDREWKVFTQRVSDSKVVPIASRSTVWMPVAAAIVVLFAAGYAALYFIPGGKTVRTAANTEIVQLPDGSTVTLNHQSVITYNTGFGESHRQLDLVGEAFFDVKPDTKVPFVINVGAVEVKVVGTSFNVRGYAGGAEVVVTVASGVVTMREANAGEVTLEAGNKGTLNRKQKQLAAASSENTNYLSWNTRRLVFSGTSLKQVVDDLNKTYRTNIKFAAGVPETCVITVTFDQQTLDAVLEVLKNTLNLTIERNGDRIVITSAGC
jgi:ferric-dicitrate binding protein FerR (iron transport regulator)